MEHVTAPPPLPIVTIETHLRNPGATIVFVNAAKRTLRCIPEFTGMNDLFKDQGIVSVFDLIRATDEQLRRVVVMGRTADTFVDPVLAQRNMRRVKFDPAIERFVRELARLHRLPRVHPDYARSA